MSDDEHLADDVPVAHGAVERGSSVRNLNKKVVKTYNEYKNV